MELIYTKYLTFIQWWRDTEETADDFHTRVIKDIQGLKYTIIRAYIREDRAWLEVNEKTI
jgi:hypothetical protein